MKRLSSLVLGLLLAVGFNIGLLSTARVLWTNQAARTSLEAAARQQVQNGTAAGTGGPTGDLAVSTAQLRAAAGDGLPIGWNAQTRPSTFWGWLGGVAGWLAMAVGVSFGAPFWFDALGRIVNLRLSGPKPGERSDLPGGAVNIVTGYASQLLKVLAEHDDVDAIWCFADEASAAAAKAYSVGNLKQVFTNEGRAIDWFNPKLAEGRWFLEHATQVKNIWVPYGE